MGRRTIPLSCFFLLLFLTFSASQGFTLEKVKIGGIMFIPTMYLPLSAAEEKGIWEQNGLAPELVSFGSAPLTVQALAAKGIDFGMASVSTVLPAAARGVPLVIVGGLEKHLPFVFWVQADSRIREPKDLKGAKIGIHRFGGPAHVVARGVLASLGWEEKDVKFAASGGISQEIAAFKARVTDVLVNSVQPAPLAKAKLAGEIRELLNVIDYLPNQWTGSALFTLKEFGRSHPEKVRRFVRSIGQAGSVVQKDQQWAIRKMMEASGYTRAEAQLVYDSLIKGNSSTDARVDSLQLQNVIDFFVKYGLLPKEKAPRLEDVYSPEFAR